MTELDPTIHAPTRLRIVSTLSVLDEGDRLSFTRLQNVLDLTPGNLITHLRKLADVGYIDMSKDDAESATTVELTTRGRLAYDDYRSTLRKLIGD